MSDNSDQQTTSTSDEQNPEERTLYQATVSDSEYIITANTELDAKMLAASKHKENQSGPEVGQYVSELAHHVKLSPVEINTNNSQNYNEGFNVTNGDPYIAVFSRTEPSDNAPSQKRIISLGTGYHSFDDLLRTTEMIIANPSKCSLMVTKEPLTFAPTHVDLFSLCGSAHLDYEQQ